MRTLKLYIKPEVELISNQESFMLELSVYNDVVDDEATNNSFFDEDANENSDPFFD